MMYFYIYQVRQPLYYATLHSKTVVLQGQALKKPYHPKFKTRDKMKSKVINFRLTKELNNVLILKSSEANMTTSDFLRSAIIDARIQINRDKNIAKKISAINQIGNNINQIARTLNIANAGDFLSDLNYENILNELIIIEERLSQELTK